MKIKLVSPKMTLRPMDSEFKRAMAPSLGLLTLGALTPRHHQVYLEDENVSDLLLRDEPDIVGIIVNVDTSTRAYEIADQYRERNIRVILGGIHVSANPEEALEHSDSVCIGEAEDVWEDILKDAANNRLLHKYQSPAPPDPAKIPIPRWDLIDASRYNTSHVVFEPKNMTAEQLSQGYLWIYKEFYSFRNIFKRMPSNQKQRIPFLLFNFVYRKYGRLMSRFAKLGFMNRMGRLARKLSYGID